VHGLFPEQEAQVAFAAAVGIPLAAALLFVLCGTAMLVGPRAVPGR
jgi:hypothetical protein